MSDVRDWRGPKREAMELRKRQGMLRVLNRICNPGGCSESYFVGCLHQIVGYHRARSTYLLQPWVYHWDQNVEFYKSPPTERWVKITDAGAFLECLVGDGKLTPEESLLIQTQLTLELV